MKQGDPNVTKVKVPIVTVRARQKANRDYDQERLEELYLKIEFVGPHAVILFYRDIDGEITWYYTATKKVDNILLTSVKIGSYDTLVAWVKDNFKDVEHKKITFVKGPNISKLWGTGR